MIRRKVKHVIDKFYFASYLIKYLAALALSPFYKNREEWKDLWLISERGTDARDNGFYLFRYLRTEHPGLNVRYLISDASADAPKVKALGKTIPYLSFRNYLAISLARLKISTHIMGFTPNPWFFTILERKGLIPGKKVFLQHGITKDNVPFFHYSNTRPDLFVCAAGKEEAYVRSVYGHPEGVVRLLGFCRYDGLPLEEERAPSRTVLVMPTWRQYLEGIPRTGGAFRKTEYYRAWNAFLSNPRLRDILDRNGWRLVFYPHLEVQPFLQQFAGGGRVELASFRDYDVQELLIEADILVTDYSSVFFDFGYMGKPVFYYQFDQEAYRKGHYGEGWFSYEAEGLGPVCSGEERMVASLERQILEGDGYMPEYRDRALGLFGFHDHENCRRNYEAIRKL